MKQAELTDPLIESLPPAESGQYVVRDTIDPGYLLVVGRTTKTFTVQVDVTDPLGKRRTKKRAVGQWPETRAKKARQAARLLRAELAQDRSDPKARAMTLGEGWTEYRADLAQRGKSNRTVETYDYGVTLLAEWADTPLRALSENPALVRRKHIELTESNGPGAANMAMTVLGIVYRWARKTRLADLPPTDPTDAVTANPSRRRDTAMSASELSGWFKQLQALPNPIRREFHLLTLLSGSRNGALAEARWEHVNVARRVLHIPNPKGGRDRAYDIPLSREMIRSLGRVRRAGRKLNPAAAAIYIFPQNGALAPLGNVAEDRSKLSHFGGDLRQTYITLADEAGLSEIDAMILTNHTLGGVHRGYKTRSKVSETHLRAQQQRLSSYLMKNR